MCQNLKAKLAISNLYQDHIESIQSKNIYIPLVIYIHFNSFSVYRNIANFYHLKILFFATILCFCFKLSIKFRLIVIRSCFFLSIPLGSQHLTFSLCPLLCVLKNESPYSHTEIFVLFSKILSGFRENKFTETSWDFETLTIQIFTLHIYSWLFLLFE